MWKRIYNTSAKPTMAVEGGGSCTKNAAEQPVIRDKSPADAEMFMAQSLSFYT
jgi:hypothetical protein